MSAVRPALLFCAVVAALLGIDTYASTRWEEALAEEIAVLRLPHLGESLVTPGPRPDECNEDLLRRSPRDAVVLVGSSVVMTACEFDSLEQELELQPDAEVAAFASYGGVSLDNLRRIATSNWRPRMVLVDVGPRSVSDPARQPRARRSKDDASEGQGGARVTQGLGALLDAPVNAAWESWFPWTEGGHDTVEQARIIRGGLRNGLMNYACSIRGIGRPYRDLRGQALPILVTDGVQLADLRRERVAASREYIRTGSRWMREHMEGLLVLSEQLAADGVHVVIANFPLATELRSLDQELNRQVYREFVPRIASAPGVHWIDLGADQALQDIPFFDGHHRDAPAAVLSAPRLAELLAPHVPSALVR